MIPLLVYFPGFSPSVSSRSLHLHIPIARSLSICLLSSPSLVLFDSCPSAVSSVPSVHSFHSFTLVPFRYNFSYLALLILRLSFLTLSYTHSLPSYSNRFIDGELDYWLHFITYAASYIAHLLPFGELFLDIEPFRLRFRTYCVRDL